MSSRSPADVLLLSVERLRVAVQAQHWQASIEACEQVRVVLERIVGGSRPEAFHATARQAMATLREIHLLVGREMVRLPQEIARLENYRTALSAYAHHDLPLDDAP